MTDRAQTIAGQEAAMRRPCDSVSWPEQGWRAQQCACACHFDSRPWVKPQEPSMQSQKLAVARCKAHDKAGVATRVLSRSLQSLLICQPQLRSDAPALHFIHFTSFTERAHCIMGGKVIEVTSSSEWSKRLADASSSKKAVCGLMVDCLLRSSMGCATHVHRVQPLRYCCRSWWTSQRLGVGHVR